MKNQWETWKTALNTSPAVIGLTDLKLAEVGAQFSSEDEGFTGEVSR